MTWWLLPLILVLPCFSEQGKMAAEKTQGVLLHNDWRIAPPIGFPPDSSRSLSHTWQRPGPGQSDREEEISAGASMVLMKDKKPVAPRDRHPMLFGSVIEGSHFGHRTYSFTCLYAGFLTAWVEEVYLVDITTLPRSSGIDTLRLVYKSYFPKHFLPGRNAAGNPYNVDTYKSAVEAVWRKTPENARDKLLPGRSIFRQMLTTLAPIEPAARAESPEKTAVPLLR